MLDVRCGSGRALNLMAAPSPQPLHRLRPLRRRVAAVARSRKARRDNVRFEVRDAAGIGDGHATTSSPPSMRSTTRRGPRRC